VRCITSVASRCWIRRSGILLFPFSTPLPPEPPHSVPFQPSCAQLPLLSSLPLGMWSENKGSIGTYLVHFGHGGQSCVAPAATLSLPNYPGVAVCSRVSGRPLAWCERCCAEKMQIHHVVLWLVNSPFRLPHGDGPRPILQTTVGARTTRPRPGPSTTY